MGINISLNDKYELAEGRAYMTAIQALVRIPLVQRWRDNAAGLNTAGFISGYRGSPLGHYDAALRKAEKYLKAENIYFEEGINEELGATAVWGTQQVNMYRQAKYDGVFGIWYGKGPGVDRSGDVLRHANAAGTSPHGGVLAIAGDDHACKSSTIPHQSDHTFYSTMLPMLYPANMQEFVEYGLLGIAMSRYAGAWVGFKVISDTIETTGVVDLAGEHRQFVLPNDFEISKKSELNIIHSINHEVESVAESAIFNLLILKNHYPNLNMRVFTNELNKIESNGKTAKIRYKAQLANWYLTNKDITGEINFNHEVDVNIYFNTLADKLKSILIASK